VLTALAFEKSAEKDLTIAAIYALGATRTISAVPRLFDLAETHANSVMRGAAVTAIGHIGDRSVLGRLLLMVRENSAEVRRSAIIAVGEIATADDPASVDVLARAAKDESDHSARRFAIMALGRIGGRAAIESLSAVVDKSDDADAAFAALAIGIAGSRTKDCDREALGVRVHLGMKRAKSCETIGAWAVACGLLHRTDAIVDIVGIMESKAHGHLRLDCAHALGLMGEKKVLAKLVERVRFDDDIEVRYGALQAIMMLGDRSTVAVIDGLIESTGGSVPVGSATLRGHGLLEKSATIVALGRVLRDTSGTPASLRLAAAMALGRLGDRDDVSPLRRLGRAENYTLQSNALGKILGQLMH
jgi:HEAT repeat protein